MRYALLLCLVLVGCAHQQTHTTPPSLGYAKSAVVDAKDFNRKVIKSSDEIDELVKKLLQDSSE